MPPKAPKKPKIPKLPATLNTKISKTGQTRGADDDVIYQNRVSRNNTVLIPYSQWDICRTLASGEAQYEKGFIVLLSPEEYFDNPDIDAELATVGLALGQNALVFYETRGNPPGI